MNFWFAVCSTLPDHLIISIYKHFPVALKLCLWTDCQYAVCSFEQRRPSSHVDFKSLTSFRVESLQVTVYLKIFSLLSDSSLNGNSFRQGTSMSLWEYLLNEEHVWSSDPHRSRRSERTLQPHTCSGARKNGMQTGRATQEEILFSDLKWNVEEEGWTQ
jgi:hypothetical protein